jgi:hypothetical protein
MVTGYYSPDGNNVIGFIADASQDPISVVQDNIASCPDGYTVVYPGGINNNGQVVGYSEGGGRPAGFWLDASGCQQLNFGSANGIAFSLNDYAQIVGELIDGPYPGVVLVPSGQ